MGQSYLYFRENNKIDIVEFKEPAVLIFKSGLKPRLEMLRRNKNKQKGVVYL